MKNVFEDVVAEPFMKVSNEIVLTLLKGRSPEDAIRNFNNEIEKLREYWLKRPHPDSGTIRKYLKDLKKQLYMHLH